MKAVTKAERALITAALAIVEASDEFLAPMEDLWNKLVRAARAVKLERKGGKE